MNHANRLRARHPFGLGLVLPILLPVALSGCMQSYTTRDTPFSNPSFAQTQAGPGEQPACFDRTTTPALTETRTEQALIRPATTTADGSAGEPAMFRTVTVQTILRDRRDVEFEAPCPGDMTPEFIASLQRALTARGYYSGAITGTMDPTTRAAIARYQTDRGDVPTDILTLRTARTLGLSARPLNQL